MTALPPSLVLLEDAHLLAVNKLPGWNTHAPAPHAGEGIYEWLRRRSPDLASLSILHRLDKETSGVLLFGKTAEANRSLTAQFTGRSITKCYHLLTRHPVPEDVVVVKSFLCRVGDRYHSRPAASGGEFAETHFRVLDRSSRGTLLEARPLTGRTHQIRVHAADQGWPILGDTLYGGNDGLRLCLHAESIEFEHPESGGRICLKTEPHFDRPAPEALRSGCIVPAETNAFRLIHGASDDLPGLYVDRWDAWLLAQAGRDLSVAELEWLEQLMQATGARGVYFKSLDRQVRRTAQEDASPRLVLGTGTDEVTIRENGMQYRISFQEGYSVGLFLDQRENRRRFLSGYVAPGCFMPGTGTRRLLNAFAYTCGFSVCAAQAGWVTTSLDLSRKYLDWGRQNFALNDLDLAGHDFIFGDAMDWMRRLARKGRRFEAIVLDPPTFSQSRERGVFRAETDFGDLVAMSLPLLEREGWLLASCNAARWDPEDFVTSVRSAVQQGGRKVLQEVYIPQPPDFPISRGEPAYLKTLWLQIR